MQRSSMRSRLRRILVAAPSAVAPRAASWTVFGNRFSTVTARQRSPSLRARGEVPPYRDIRRLTGSLAGLAMAGPRIDGVCTAPYASAT